MARNSGIDAFRVVAMLFIVVWHILLHGGIFQSVEPMSTNAYLASFLSLIVIPGVNCYALISGYVGVNARFRYRHIFKLYLWVMFYSVFVSIAVIFLFADHVSWGMVRNAFLPVTTTQYWYFTAYFVMYFFIPGFNFLLHNMSKKDLQRLIIAIVVLFSIVPTIANKDIFATYNGMNALWLGALYMIGGYIRLYGLNENIIEKKPFCCYSCLLLISWLVKMGIEFGYYEWGGCI